MNLKLSFSLVPSIFLQEKWYRPENSSIPNKLQAQNFRAYFQKEVNKILNMFPFGKKMKELELIHQNLSKYLKPDDPEIEKSSHNKLPSL